MPKLAKTINVKRRGREATLTIDGEEFAWYLADEPITHTMESKAISTVNLTLIAEHITIDDDSEPVDSTHTADRGPDIVAIVGTVPEGAEQPEPDRCTLCLGPTGDDSRRCELPRGHEDPDHLFKGVKHRLAPGVTNPQG